MVSNTMQYLIPKSDYNHSFNNFKICNICQNSPKEIKSKTGARFEPVTHRLLSSLKQSKLCRMLLNFVRIKTIMKGHFYCLFWKEVYRYFTMEVFFHSKYALLPVYALNTFWNKQCLIHLISNLKISHGHYI